MPQKSSRQDQDTSKRTASAPIGFMGGSIPARNHVMNVNLKEGEEVEWTWTYWPDGSASVTGYTIISPPKKTASQYRNKKKEKKQIIFLGRRF